MFSDLIGIRCPSLQKSSRGYIKLLMSKEVVLGDASSWGRSGETSLFCGLRVLSELARHEIVSVLKPRGVWIQVVLGVP